MKTAIVRLGELSVAVVTTGNQLFLRPEGYGDKTSQEGHGFPIMLELEGATLRLIAWADINSEDPTHVIDLSGALEGRRQ